MKDTTGLNSKLNYQFLEKINEIIEQIVLKYDDKELGVLLSQMLMIEPKERPNMFDLIGKKENYEDPKEFPIVHYLLFNNR